MRIYVQRLFSKITQKYTKVHKITEDYQKADNNNMVTSIFIDGKMGK